MTAPAAPLEKAVEEIQEAIAVSRTAINRWIVDDRRVPKADLVGYLVLLADLTEALLAALDADLPRLLAVAKAAVEWDEAENDNMAPHPDEVCLMGPGDCAACTAVERRFQRVLVARTALRAAVRGEGKETT